MGMWRAGDKLSGLIRQKDILGKPLCKLQMMPEEQREVTSLFHASLHLENQEDAKKAVLETVCRLKRDSIAWQSQHLAPTDLAGLQKIVEARKRLEDLERGRVTLHISFD